MATTGGFFTELRRRNVLRLAGLYIVGAWLVIQVAGTLLPMFGAPGWMARSVVILLAIGFVPVMVFGWVFELTPQGLKRDVDVTTQESIAPQTARRLDRMIIAVLLLAVTYFGFDKFVLAPRREAEQSALTAKATAQPAATAVAPAINKKSIAVLPFTDLSPGRDQEYFSDGMAEEILNALAQVKDLKVAGRTSSFYYKGRNEKLTTIGETLGVANVLEGSVRKQGNKVRITAQLIQTKDGFHLWSQTYDGDLKDVFALQERIARAITDQLKVVLQGAQEKRLVNAGTANAEAYALYLQATAIFNRRDGERFGQAMAQVQQAITLDPAFARAYSRLATLHVVNTTYRSGDFDASMAAVEKYVRRASELDPTLAEPHAALGIAMGNRRLYREQRETFARAIALDPDDVTVNFWYGNSLMTTGYHRQGKAAVDRALQIDPLLPNALLWRGRAYVADGDLASAERMLRRADESGHAFVGLGLAWLEHARGNRAAAIAQLARGLKYFVADFPPEAAPMFARASFGDPAAKMQALALIDAYLASRPARIPGIVPFVLIRSGEVARGFALMQDQGTNNDNLVLGEVLSPLLPDARRAPQFAEFARRMGLAAYWDAYGPPDLCRKAANGDYVCD